jgi:hypothetical protein
MGIIWKKSISFWFVKVEHDILPTEHVAEIVDILICRTFRMSTQQNIDIFSCRTVKLSTIIYTFCRHNYQSHFAFPCLSTLFSGKRFIYTKNNFHVVHTYCTCVGRCCTTSYDMKFIFRVNVCTLIGTIYIVWLG